MSEPLTQNQLDLNACKDEIRALKEAINGVNGVGGYKAQLKELNPPNDEGDMKKDHKDFGKYKKVQKELDKAEASLGPLRILQASLTNAVEAERNREENRLAENKNREDGMLLNFIIY
jgi:hypothetical protein